MSSNPKTDGGSENSFSPDVVESEADLAEAMRMPHARDADKVMEVLEETNAVAIQLESSWWGNNAFGVWSEWFFVHPTGVSPSGKALFVDQGIAASDPIRHLERAEGRAEPNNGWTSGAVRRARKKALKDWEDNYGVGPGAPPDDRDVFADTSAPLSVIETAVRAPEPQDDLVFPVEGDARKGAMSEGDIRVTRSTRTEYGPKYVLEGDTYNALSQDGDNACADVWDDAHVAYNGNVWTCDLEGSALLAVARALNEHGYSFAVDESFESEIEDSRDIASSFGVDL